MVMIEKEITTKNRKKKNIGSLLDAFKFAGKGIWKAFYSERSFRLQIIIFALTVIAGFIFKISKIEWLIVLLASAGVLALEMLNTTLEALVDLVTEESKVLAERVKDITAGSVLIMAVFSFVIGLVIFVPRIIDFFKG